jgi:glycerol-3-phosphate dehydrogenase
MPYQTQEERRSFQADLAVYDSLADQSLPPHRFVGKGELSAIEPLLSRDVCEGAALFYEAQVLSPERLCLEYILDAEQAGACILNYTRVVRSIREFGRLVGVVAQCQTSGAEVEYRAKLIVNASGPWCDHVCESITGCSCSMSRKTKGIHVATRLALRNAIVFRSSSDGRQLMAVPLLGSTLIGTTDTDFCGNPQDARVEHDEMLYLLRSSERIVPDVASAPLLYTTAGVRSLIASSGDPSSVTRSHKIVDGQHTGLQGLLSVVGGKITTSRAVAEDVTNTICNQLGNSELCSTADRPIPGARPGKLQPSVTDGISTETLAHLDEIYGSRATEVLNIAANEPSLQKPLSPAGPEIAAEIVFAIRREHARHLSDVFFRRSVLAYRPDTGAGAIHKTTQIVAREFGWCDSRIKVELAPLIEWTERHLHV